MGYILFIFGFSCFLDGALIIFIMRKHIKEELREFIHMLCFVIVGLILMTVGVLLIK